jgi:hypothetical protein
MPVVQYACNKVDIERSTAYRQRVNDKEFAAAWDEAMEAGIDRAEQEAIRRGVVGFEEPVVYQGQLTPVWQRDEAGELVLDTYTDGSTYPKGHEKAGQLIALTRPVQAKDANGQPQWLTVRKHSDALLSLVLKARRKAYSTERTELTNPDGTLAPIDETTRAARIAQLMAAGKARKAAQAAEDDNGDLA